MNLHKMNQYDDIINILQKISNNKQPILFNEEERVSVKKFIETFHHFVDMIKIKTEFSPPVSPFYCGTDIGNDVQVPLPFQPEFYNRKRTISANSNISNASTRIFEMSPKRCYQRIPQNMIVDKHCDYGIRCNKKTCLFKHPRNWQYYDYNIIYRTNLKNY